MATRTRAPANLQVHLDALDALLRRMRSLPESLDVMEFRALVVDMDRVLTAARNDGLKCKRIKLKGNVPVSLLVMELEGIDAKWRG